MRLLSLPLVILWLAVAPGHAQRTSMLTGRVVVAEAGSARADIAVQVVDYTETIVDVVFTDTSGRFIVNVPLDSPGGVYLSIEEDGFRPVRERINLRQVSGLYTIYLEPAASEDPADIARGDGELLVDLRQLVAEIPEEARDEYSRAEDDIEEGRFDRAVERLERAVELAPDYYDAWVRLGVQHINQGRVVEAETALLSAVEVNPSGSLAPMNLGILRYQQAEALLGSDQPDTAIEVFGEGERFLDTAVQLDPGSGTGLTYLGMTRHRLGDYAGAETALTNALALNPASREARLMLINVYTRQNRLSEALDQASIFLEEHPDAPERAAIERVRQQIEDALGR